MDPIVSSCRFESSFSKFGNKAVILMRANWAREGFVSEVWPREAIELEKVPHTMLIYNCTAQRVDVHKISLGFPPGYDEVSDYAAHIMAMERLRTGINYTSGFIIVLHEADFHSIMNVE